MPNDAYVYRPVREEFPSVVPSCSDCGGDSPYGPICGDCAQRYRAALVEIINPLLFMRQRAEANGDRLSGMAYGITNSVEYLRGIARDALRGSGLSQEESGHGG